MEMKGGTDETAYVYLQIIIIVSKSKMRARKKDEGNKSIKTDVE